MIRSRTVAANGLEFGLLEAGDSPLALCLHGFPDTAHTFRHLLPELAGAGFHAVAPFMRGYAPSAVPADGTYGVGALIADAIGLHDALDGDERAVVIGHDWGADAALGAASFAPDRWRTAVSLAGPPLALDPVLYADYEQLKRFFYVFLLRDAPEAALELVAAQDMAFLDRLWADWSPGFDGSANLAAAKDSLRDRRNLAAALAYYTAESQGDVDLAALPFADQERAAREAPPMPVLYLHGRQDGCVLADLISAAEPLLAAGSRVEIVERAGHFLHVERPAEVNRRIREWLAG